MGNIVLLDDLTINKIAAGEVIERPASVVKELMENSIDAGADNISIEIKNGGISYIRITDNGKGFEADDLEIAFERHATSKIRSADDLELVKTMGFRGEALASIAAIARVELVTKTADSEVGHKIVVEGGKVITKEDVGCPKGSSITIQNLFYNTPVRYKFLKKDFTESGYIEDAITRIALVNPNIAIKFINTGKTVIQTSGNGDIRDIIYGIYGKDIAENIINVEYHFEDMAIKGVIGKPSVARSNRSNQLFFVNKRYVKDKTLTSAAEQGFKGLLGIGKFGFLILNLEIDPQKLDVNVHPAKLEVRFQDESKIFKLVYHAIKESLLKAGLIKGDGKSGIFSSNGIFNGSTFLDNDVSGANGGVPGKNGAVDNDKLGVDRGEAGNNGDVDSDKLGIDSGVSGNNRATDSDRSTDNSRVSNNNETFENGEGGASSETSSDKETLNNGIANSENNNDVVGNSKVSNNGEALDSDKFSAGGDTHENSSALGNGLDLAEKAYKQKLQEEQEAILNSMRNEKANANKLNYTDVTQKDEERAGIDLNLIDSSHVDIGQAKNEYDKLEREANNGETDNDAQSAKYSEFGLNAEEYKGNRNLQRLVQELDANFEKLRIKPRMAGNDVAENASFVGKEDSTIQEGGTAIQGDNRIHERTSQTSADSVSGLENNSVENSSNNFAENYGSNMEKMENNSFEKYRNDIGKVKNSNLESPSYDIEETKNNSNENYKNVKADMYSNIEGNKYNSTSEIEQQKHDNRIHNGNSYNGENSNTYEASAGVNNSNSYGNSNTIENNNPNQEQINSETTEKESDLNFEEMYAKMFGTKIPNRNKVEEENQNGYTVKQEDLKTVEKYSLFTNSSVYSRPAYKFIGIIFESNIIIEYEREMYIVNQRAADERILYEKLKNNYYNNTKDSQLMLLPDVIELTEKQMGIAKDNTQVLKNAGFEIEEFGENTIKLTAVPSFCIELDTKDLFLQILNEVNTVARTARQEREEKIFETVAKEVAKSVKLAITPQEVDSLMCNLLALPQPFESPRGTPTAIRMSKADIERKFSRR